MSIETQVPITPEQLKILGEKIIEAFPDGVSMSLLTKAVIDCMSMVGQIQNMSGINKKQLVIDMLQFILEKTDSGLFEVMEPVISYMIPDIIDSLIEVEKGKLKFNPKIKNKLSYLPCL